MERGRMTSGFFFAGINNSARHEALSIVDNASGSAELFDAAKAHFDKSILSLSSNQILDRFNDEKLAPILRSTVEFDATLFKAAVLFELSHPDDELIIPEVVEKLIGFWQQAEEYDSENRYSVADEFVSESRRGKPAPFSVMSELVTSSLVSVRYSEIHERRITELESKPKKQPLEEEIDGVEYTLFAGKDIIEFPVEDTLLTKQLQKDLRKLYPIIVISELEDRLPKDAEFADIQPLIDKIIEDRQTGAMPSNEDLVSMYIRSQDRMSTMFGDRHKSDVVSTDDERLKKATERYRRLYRTKPQVTPWDYYVPSTGLWYTVVQMALDEDTRVRYRKIYLGDMTTTDLVELPVEERSEIIAYLDDMEDRARKVAGSQYPDIEIRDIVGSFDAVLPEYYKHYDSRYEHKIIADPKARDS